MQKEHCKEQEERPRKEVCMCHIGREEEKEQEHCKKEEEKPRKKSLHASYLP
jgi:hypothetical protein